MSYINLGKRVVDRGSNMRETLELDYSGNHKVSGGYASTGSEVGRITRILISHGEGF